MMLSARTHSLHQIPVLKLTEIRKRAFFAVLFTHENQRNVWREQKQTGREPLLRLGTKPRHPNRLPLARLPT